MGHGILLEAGTNEMELLVFRVGETFYGVNVAKVRELVQRIPAIEVPNAPDAVEGSFRLREEVLTLVDLGKYLEGASTCKTEEDGLIIIIELNQARCGVLVDAVEMIHRVGWGSIKPPSSYLTAMGTPVTAVAQIDDRVVLILDFETILGDLLGVGAPEADLDGAPLEVPEHKDMRVLIADDSPTIRQTVQRVLALNGFEHVTVCNDGQEAWDAIEERCTAEPGQLPFDLVLTDVEMPRMDGLHLTARIRERPELKTMPVILFSSLISNENRNKGEAVGADAQVTKFHDKELIVTIDECMQNRG